MTSSVAAARKLPTLSSQARPVRDDPPGWWLVGASGSALLGVSAATQAMLAAMLLVPCRLDPGVFDQLTQSGRIFFRPEHDMAFYLAGCGAALALTLALTWRWTRRFDRTAPADRAGYALACFGRQTILALMATIVHVAMLGGVEPTPWVRAVWLAGPGVCAVVAAFVWLSRAPGRGARTLAGRLREPGSPRIEGNPARRAVDLSAMALALLIASIVMVPSCHRLAGSFAFLDDVPFHHWDYFVMGPALGHLHGGALGTDVYSQYGVAWPLLYSWLAPLVPLSYGNVLTVSVIVGTVYFVAFGLILRHALGSTWWAAAGTVFAIVVQMHSGIHPEMTIWMTPSSSILRYPVDLWFFLALLLGFRTGKAGWWALAGGCAGLGVLFETDTGIYLVATLAVTLAGLVARPVVRFPGGRPVAIAACASAFAATLLGGLSIASRGTILHRAFWAGWLEPLRIYGGGMSAMPVSTADGIRGPVVFLLVSGAYLVVLGLLLASLVRGLRVAPRPLLAGALSVYGLCLLLQYVNRSHVFNIYHSLLPFCALAAAGAAGAASGLARLGPGGRRAGGWAPRVAFALAVATLVATPGFRAYPSVWARLIAGKPAKGLTLMAGVEGVPPGRREFVAEFRAVSRRLRALRATGKTIGVLDPADTMLALAAGLPPIDRYATLMTQIIRKDELAAAERRLDRSRLDLLVIRDSDWPRSRWGDVRAALLATVSRDYVCAERVGAYGLWARSRP